MPMIEDDQPIQFTDVIREYNSSSDANFLFLNSTLVPCLKINSRNSVSYFSPRRWRKGIKPLQISALKNLKLQPREDGVYVIARQIAEMAVTLTNGMPYEFVTNVPGRQFGTDMEFCRADRLLRGEGAGRLLPTGSGRPFVHPRSIEPSQAERKLSAWLP